MITLVVETVYAQVQRLSCNVHGCRQAQIVVFESIFNSHLTILKDLFPLSGTYILRIQHLPAFNSLSLFYLLSRALSEVAQPRGCALHYQRRQHRDQLRRLPRSKTACLATGSPSRMLRSGIANTATKASHAYMKTSFGSF